MTSENCISPLPGTTHTVRLCWMVGCVLSGIGYGALLVVGYACYVELRRRSSPGEGNLRVKNVLMIYVVFTLLLMTAVELLDIMATVNSVMDDVCFFQNLQPPNPYLGHLPIPILLIDITTDSLFIWRCYTVCGGLRGQRGWFTLLWVTPLFVYIAMLCTGFIVIVRYATFKSSQPIFDIRIPIMYGITGLLNVLVTVSIIILVLCYRRDMAEALGRDCPLPYVNLMVVLVESASLVVLIDVFVIVTYVIEDSIWISIAVQGWIPMQPLASFLIIYRVSRGSDYFSQQSEQISSLRFEQVSGPV